jgi:uncharacterized protein (DUF3084 family)
MIAGLLLALLAIDVRSVITVLIIVIIAGAIAFVGDRVGHNVGRRRMTLFGLRPRYTSTIFAVGFGMFIALAVIVFVSLVNQEARQALFSINTLNDQIKTLTAERDQLLQEPVVFRNGEPIFSPVVMASTDEQPVIEKGLEQLFLGVAGYYRTTLPDVRPYPKTLAPAARANLVALAKTVKSFAPTAAIIVPVAGENIFRHGAMSISFRVYEDRLIYAKGEIIAHIDLRDASDRQLLSQAMSQLAGDIFANATAHGMPDSIANDPTITPNAIDRVVRQLSTMRGPAVVQALAANAIYAHGPLTTEVVVEPATLPPVH